MTPIKSYKKFVSCDLVKYIRGVVVIFRHLDINFNRLLQLQELMIAAAEEALLGERYSYSKR